MAEDSTEASALDKIGIHIIRGLPFDNSFKKEIIEGILDFMPQDEDIIIATYPKTGTTWMQYIVLQILTKAEIFPDFNDMLEKVVPFLEMSGVKAVEAMKTKPRVYKHHIPYNAMKKNPNSKIIYIYRKPDDVFVSFYHMMKSLDETLDFDEYFDNFVSGNIMCGRYFEHILSYLERKEDGNILFVSYEKLQVHRKEEILRIAKFLGKEYHDALVKDESILKKIIEKTNFDYMKKNLIYTVPKDPRQDMFAKGVPRREITFFRKGVIGDGKNTLSDDQLKQLKRLAQKVMKGTPILAEWYSQ